MTDSHPALHPAAASTHAGGSQDPELAKHFVPVGWEETDRGLCPCGEAVTWDDAKELWIPDRSLVVFVLTADEARHLRDDALMVEDLEPLLDLQLALNADPDEEPDDGEVLIAGVLYDAETLEEAHPLGELEPVLAGMTALELRAMDGDR